jgi:hypothetical protein
LADLAVGLRHIGIGGPSGCRGEGFGYAGRRDAGVVDQHVDLAGLSEHVVDARFDRRVVANVQLHGLDAKVP